MSEAPRYSIRTVKDFLDVPIDRLPICLDEFRAWLALAIATRELVKDVRCTNDPFAVYEWIDDDKGDVRAVVRSGEETLAEFGFRMSDV